MQFCGKSVTVVFVVLHSVLIKFLVYWRVHGHNLQEYTDMH